MFFSSLAAPDGRKWREAHFDVKIVKKNCPEQSTFGNRGVEKVHAAAAGSTCRIIGANTSGSKHFWKLSC